MYINLKTVKKNNLTLPDVLAMQVLKQNSWDSFEEHEWLEANLDTLSEHFMTTVKPKTKTTTKYACLRLNKVGKDLLEEVQEAQVEEQDKVIMDWLVKLYLDSSKKLGNKKKTLRHIASFRSMSGISKNSLAYLCQQFVEDTENFEYNHILEFMFFKPASVFTTKFNLEESRLYLYYEDRKDFFDKKFQTLTDC